MLGQRLGGWDWTILPTMLGDVLYEDYFWTFQQTTILYKLFIFIGFPYSQLYVSQYISPGW